MSGAGAFGMSITSTRQLTFATSIRRGFKYIQVTQKDGAFQMMLRRLLLIDQPRLTLTAFCLDSAD